jgi:hypothetical protein
MTLLCKKIVVTKSKEVKTGCNLIESSKECYGSESAVLPMMMIFLRFDFILLCLTEANSINVLGLPALMGTFNYTG